MLCCTKAFHSHRVKAAASFPFGSPSFLRFDTVLPYLQKDCTAISAPICLCGIVSHVNAVWYSEYFVSSYPRGPNQGSSHYLYIQQPKLISQAYSTDQRINSSQMPCAKTIVIA
jgi:hypothetical protein